MYKSLSILPVVYVEMQISQLNKCDFYLTGMLCLVV